MDGAWPHSAATVDAPRALEHARAIAVALREALTDRTVIEVAAGADLARSTIYDVVGGAT